MLRACSGREICNNSSRSSASRVTYDGCSVTSPPTLTTPPKSHRNGATCSQFKTDLIVLGADVQHQAGWCSNSVHLIDGHAERGFHRNFKDANGKQIQNQLYGIDKKKKRYTSFQNLIPGNVPPFVPFSLNEPADFFFKPGLLVLHRK